MKNFSIGERQSGWNCLLQLLLVEFYAKISEDWQKKCIRFSDLPSNVQFFFSRNIRKSQRSSNYLVLQSCVLIWVTKFGCRV